MAESGSFAEMKLRAEIDEVAEVGGLPKRSRSPKEPERERSLVSDDPDVADPEICSGGSRGCGGRPPSAGVAIVPMGVLSFSAGGSGRASCAAMSVVPLITGRTLGDGGIERPRRGGREAEFEREPGMGGRRRGAGEDMAGGGGVEESEGVEWCGGSLEATVGSVVYAVLL